MMERFKEAQGVPDVALLLLGEFQSVAEDLESRLFITESTCLGRLTADTEHLPKKPRERHTDVHKGNIGKKNRGGRPWRPARTHYSLKERLHYFLFSHFLLVYTGKPH